VDLIIWVMAIKTKDLEWIREKIKKSVRPLFFFDDDADGLCSFLLLYRMVKEGKGVIIKTSPDLSIKYLAQVNEFSPDLVVILDKPEVSQEFLDKINVPVIWIDHHEPVKRHGVKYFNPRIAKDSDNRPTTYWAYKIAKQDLWIAAVGCVSDWHVPDFIGEFSKKYKDLLPKVYDSPPEILYGARVGELVKLFNFILKGKVKDSLACVKVLTRINDPYEILEQKSAGGKFLFKKYKNAKKVYDQLLSEVVPTKEDVLVYTYSADRTSYTSELSNEILYLNPKKLSIICREKSGEMRCSLRSAEIKVLPVLKKSLEGIRGYGGGHIYACGSCINSDDFERFVENLKIEVGKIKKKNHKN